MLEKFTDVELRIREFGRKDEGATMVEYALLVALIAVALILVIGVLSGAIGNVFQGAGDTLNGTVGG